jgi:hypothetical protein
MSLFKIKNSFLTNKIKLDLRILSLANLINQNGSLGSVRMGYTFFNHIRGKLMLRKSQNASFKLVYDARFVLRSTML